MKENRPQCIQSLLSPRNLLKSRARYGRAHLKSQYPGGSERGSRVRGQPRLHSETLLSQKKIKIKKIEKARFPSCTPLLLNEKQRLGSGREEDRGHKSNGFTGKTNEEKDITNSKRVSHCVEIMSVYLSLLCAFSYFLIFYNEYVNKEVLREKERQRERD
jgi:hypothetical protein